MSRNVNGTYTLVSGNPVVTGTLVESSWANTTMTDLATEMTDSLSRSGKGGMLAALKKINGSAGTPSGTFTNDLNSGTYLSSAGDVRMSVAGVDQMRWLGSTVEMWDVTTATWYKVFDTSDAVGMLKEPTIVATAAQELFEFTEITYVVNTNNILVFVNGIARFDYTETSTTSITFDVGLNVNDEVDVLTNVTTELVVANAQNVAYTAGSTDVASELTSQGAAIEAGLKSATALAEVVTDPTLQVNQAVLASFSGDEKGKNTRQNYRVMDLSAESYGGPVYDDSQVIQLDNGLSAVAMQTLGDSNIPFSLSRVNMHFGVCKGIPWNAAEPGGTVEFASNSAAVVGDMSLSLVDATGLVPDMVICYLADDGQVYSTVIESISVNVLALRTPIEADLASSGRVFNFYINSSHPNQWGYFAITDYALRTLNYNLSRVISVPVTDWEALGPETVTTSTTEDIYAPGSTDVPYVKVGVTAATQGAATVGHYALPEGQYLVRGLINPGSTNTAQLAMEETPEISGISTQVAVTTIEGDDTTQVFELIYYARSNSIQRIMVKSSGVGVQELEIGAVEIFRIDGIADNLDNSKHVMLGDSWFAQGHIQNRITDRLPNAVIFNEGVGGNTAANLVSRFDSDVTPHKPDYVWVICGTNDYFGSVSLDTFDFNMNVLKNKIANIGAIPIFFDPSVGEISGTNFNFSRQYANYGSYSRGALRLTPDVPAVIEPTRVNFFLDDVSIPAATTKLVYMPPGTTTVEYVIERSYFTSGTLNVKAGFATGIGVPTEDIQSYTSSDLVQPAGAITVTKAAPAGRFPAIAIENPSGGALTITGYIDILYTPTT